MKWTDSQMQAIDIPVSDIIVSAAAGSGKTAVMAERIIRRLTGEDSVDIDKILVVTYTNAAASEIKERVMKKIVEKLSESNDDSLQRQLVLLSNSHFCTIHSFCLELIKKYFYKLGIDPNVKTGDETDLNILLSEAVDNVVTEYFSSNDAGFAKLMEAYGNNSESVLSDLICEVYNFSRTMPDSDEWLDSMATSYSDSTGDTVGYICRCAASAIDYAISECEKAVELITSTSCCTEWLGNIELEKTQLYNVSLAIDNYDAMYSALHSMTFERLPAARSVDNPLLKAEIKSYRDNVKSIVNTIKEKLVCISPDDILLDNKNVYPVIRKMIEVVKRTGAEYDKLKREKNLIDFSDYEHMTLKLLKNPDGTPSDIAYTVSDSFEEIYIDEYQDCNNIQNTIFKYISGSIRNKPNVFCVGDMKQSIYKFRDANPLNFRAKCDISPVYDGIHVNNSNKILLNSNFRSRSSILDYVNSVFSQLMSDKCGELEYNDDESLKYGGGYRDINPDIDKIDIDIINESDDFGTGEESVSQPSLSKADAEAAHIASKIRSYIDSGYMLFDKKNNLERPAKYSDIVILLRSPRSYVSSFEKIFAEFKIPLYCDSGDGYFETEEIEFLISFLKIIDNPDDDIALATVMKNPIFGFDENELLAIRLGGRKGPYYKCIKEYIRKHDNNLKLRLQSFIASLDKYHNESKYMETCEFLSYLLNDIGYYVYLSTFADSKIKKSNVRFLLHKAKEFENNNFKGIFSFVRYVENIKESNLVECAKVLGSNDNVVRVMSIHKSKGLEFPIVFLSGTGKKYNMMDATGRVVLHKDLGIGVDSVYSDEGYRVPTINKLSIKQKIKYESMSEELRVLYVALTRPTEKLIITGTVKNGAAFLNSVERTLKTQNYNISPYIVSGSKCFLETILLASMRSAGFESGSFDNKTFVVNDNVSYNLTLRNISDISLNASFAATGLWENCFDSITDSYTTISKTLSYKYPYSQYSSVPGNLTVTEIKRMLSADENTAWLYDDISLQKPSNFTSGVGLYGNILGTLVHLCMEKLDLTDISDEASVTRQLNRLVAAEIISSDEKDAIDSFKIAEFGRSDVAKRISAAYSTVKKEFSFKYMVDASEFFDVDSGDEIIVQGTIDVFFEEDGELVLVDYKTDKVINGDTSSIAERYRVQLDSYAKALEHIFRKKVKEKIIYLFDTGHYISL